MNLFMQNLIMRHQEGGADSGGLPMVQPRPKARFESDLGMRAFAGDAAPAPLENYEQEDVPAPHPSNQPDNKIHPSPAPIFEPATIGTDKQILTEPDRPQHIISQPEFLEEQPQRPNARMPEWTPPLISLPEQEKYVREPVMQAGNNRQKEFQLELSEPVQRPIGLLPFSDDFNQQIQKFQQRLNEQHPDKPTFQPEIQAALSEPAGQATGSLPSDCESNQRIQEIYTVDDKSRQATMQSEPMGQGTGALSPDNKSDQRIQEVLQHLNVQQRQDADDVPLLPSEQKRAVQEVHSADTGNRQPTTRIESSERAVPKKGSQDSMNALNQQVQTLLHRLNGEEGKQAAQKQARVSSPTVSGNAPVTPATAQAVPVVTPEAAQNRVVPANNVPKVQPPKKPASTEPRQAGLLQPPVWLTAMQADLRSRWGAGKPQSQAEPVVNVTIGRVEVRAVRTKSENKPKTRQKPSGVMSLDDYLKQRENRG